MIKIAKSLLFGCAFAVGAAHSQTAAQDAGAPDVLVKNVTLEVVELITKDNTL